MLHKHALQHAPVEACKLLVAPRFKGKQLSGLNKVQGFAKLFLEQLFAETDF